MRQSYYPHEVNYSPGMPFNQQMTFPCELTLKSAHGTMRLFRSPIREVAKLHGEERRFESKTAAAGEQLDFGPGGLFHLQAELEMTEDAEGLFRFCGEEIRVANGMIGNRQREAVFLEPKDPPGHRQPIPLQTLDILVDRTSIEVFANGGETSLTAAFVPTGKDSTFACTKGQIKFKSLVVYRRDSIWNGRPTAP